MSGHDQGTNEGTNPFQPLAVWTYRRLTIKLLHAILYRITHGDIRGFEWFPGEQDALVEAEKWLVENRP